MPAVVIVYCGRDIRTAFVSDADANGDDRTEAAACLVAQHRVSSYILATGPMPTSDVQPTLWLFPFAHGLDLHTHVARFQRTLGSGPSSPRGSIMKAIRATTRTVSSSEIDAAIGCAGKAPKRTVKKKAAPVAFRRPAQLSLFEAVGA